MARMFRRKLPPINSNKHYVHRTALTIAVGAIQNVIVVQSVVAPATANSFSVEEGSIVKAIFVEIWAIADTGLTAFTMSVEKRPSSSPAMTFAQSANMGAYPNKKNILLTTQGLLADKTAGPAIPLYRQWIPIPKGKQRMGLSDELVLNVSNIGGNTFQVCGIFTYKEYR